MNTQDSKINKKSMELQRKNIEKLKNNMTNNQLGSLHSDFYTHIGLKRSYKSITQLIQNKKQNLQIPIGDPERVNQEKEFQVYLYNINNLNSANPQQKSLSLETLKHNVIALKYQLDRTIQENKTSFNSIFSVGRLNQSNVQDYLSKCQDYFLYNQVFSLNRQIVHPPLNNNNQDKFLQTNSYNNPVNNKVKKCVNQEFKKSALKIFFNNQRNNKFKKQQNIMNEEQNEVQQQNFGLQQLSNFLSQGNNIKKRACLQKKQELAQCVYDYSQRHSQNKNSETNFNQRHIQDHSILDLSRFLLNLQTIVSQNYNNNNGISQLNIYQDSTQRTEISGLFKIFSKIMENYETVSHKYGIDESFDLEQYEAQRNRQPQSLLQKNEDQIEAHQDLQKFLVQQCCDYLENLFWKINSQGINPSNIQNLLKQYYHKLTEHQNQGSRKFQNFKKNWYSLNNGLYAWGLVYFYYRAGMIKELLQFINSEDIAIFRFCQQTIQQVLLGQLKLTQQVRQDIIDELNQSSPDQYDPFKRMFYYLIAKWEKIEDQMFLLDDEDFVWVYMKMVTVQLTEENQNNLTNILTLSDAQTNIQDSFEENLKSLPLYILSLNFYQVYNILKQNYDQGNIDYDDLGHFLLCCKQARFFNLGIMYNKQYDIQTGIAENKRQERNWESKKHELENTIQLFLSFKVKELAIQHSIAYTYLAFGNDDEQMAQNFANLIIIQDKLDEYYSIILNAQLANQFFSPYYQLQEYIEQAVEQKCEQREIYNIKRIQIMVKKQQWKLLIQYLIKIFSGVLTKSNTYQISKDELKQLCNFCHSMIFAPQEKFNIITNISNTLGQVQANNQYQICIFMLYFIRFQEYQDYTSEDKLKLADTLTQMMSEQSGFEINGNAQFDQFKSSDCTEVFFFFFLEISVFLINYQKHITSCTRQHNQYFKEQKLVMVINIQKVLKSFFQDFDQNLEDGLKKTYQRKINTINHNFMQLATDVHLYSQTKQTSYQQY